MVDGISTYITCIPTDIKVMQCPNYNTQYIAPYNFGFSGCAARSGISISFISHAASFRCWLMRAAPMRLQTMLKLRLS
jgi:hypothetical protein